MPVPVPVRCFAVLAVLNLAGVALHQDLLEWLTKPLLVPLLALHLWPARGGAHRPVFAALALATAGDVALLLPGTAAFLAGTGCFLASQLCWITAFVRQGAVVHLRARWWVGAGYLAIWVVAVVVLASALGPLVWGVAPYGLALLTMAATAGVLGPRARWGGALFVASDLLVGLGVAGAGFTGRGVLVMATYAVAQYLLVEAFVRTSGSAAGRALGDGVPGVVATASGVGR